MDKAVDFKPPGGATEYRAENPKERLDELRAAPEEFLELYRRMVLFRRFEEKAGQLYGTGLIGGFCHLYIGQEAVIAGMQTVAGPGDSIITGYRDHAHMLAAGMAAKGVLAELAGRRGGYSKGKGGSMHMFSRDAGFFGGHGIVAAQVPIGAGLAFAHKYKGDGGVAFVYFGDGAANQGQVAEAYNMASLWKLPAVFIIENNGYAMGTAVERGTVITELFKRGAAFGIPALRVDGMDVLAVRDAGRMAAAHCRGGEGPYLIEAMTYRYRGHSMSDPAKYRSKEEVKTVRQDNDPIENLRAVLLESAIADQERLKGIDAEVKAEVAAAVEFAQASPEPEPAELFTDVLIAGGGGEGDHARTA